MRILLGCLVAMFVLSGSAAEIRRWVDAEGRVHFGDWAPPAVEAEVRVIDAGVAAPSPSGGLRPGEREMLKQYEERGQRLEAAKQRSSREFEQSRVSAEERKKRRARCDYYQSRLDHHLSRKRHGYSRDQGASIDSQIDLYEMKTEIYCD